MHPFLKYGLTLGSVGLSVTVAYKIYSNYRQSSSHKEICELLFTNPSASCCLGQKARANCANPYCIKKNSAKIIRHIEAAKHSISLAMLIFTYRQFMEALIRAHKRGVTVRVITDRGMEHSTGSTIKQLSDNDIPFRFYRSSISATQYSMHHKFCLIDVPSADDDSPKKANLGGILMFGSLNWTTNAFIRNWENVIITSDKKIIQPFRNEFDKLWTELA